MKHMMKFIIAVAATMVATGVEAEQPVPSCLKFKTEGKGYAVEKCDRTITGELRIPSEYQGRPVTSIGEEAFLHSRNDRFAALHCLADFSPREHVYYTIFSAPTQWPQPRRALQTVARMTWAADAT